MKKETESTLIGFILKEWLLISSLIGLILTSIYVKRLPVYSLSEFQILFILFSLFITIKGLELSGIISQVSQIIQKRKAIPLKLITATFFLSIFITNDVALIVIVPLTLSLEIKHKDIIVIFETLAANAGSALTPFGNPQNLFIYWFYNLDPVVFVTAIAPFSLFFLLFLIVFSFFIKTDNNYTKKLNIEKNLNKKSVYVYIFLFIIVLLTVLHILPVSTNILIIIYALLFNRKSLKIDYALLFTFFCFFGFAENVKFLLSSEIIHSTHIFLFSALASQIMSNVPVALLFAKFTTNWKALLWGTNVGGFGSLFGSLANLIVYKIYVAQNDTKNSGIFLLKFHVIEYIAFFLGIALYFILKICMI
ncbi:SLC13 family permease [Thermodesulfobacterium hydrogeniphilum]|uniref:SLC13 family permease n=1 Tax=Thermodesulfobacterium hydrogeniphilum TaxID=161156 RepID=UPI00056E0568|nr:SLC13 family permease [Thermodesulfobacterium hydrogeniphilum]